MSTCIQALVSNLSHIHSELSPKARLVRLRSHIRTAILGAYKWWSEFSVEHEFDGTGCIRAQERPKEHGDALDVSIPNCKRSDINCRIHKFFTENQDAFVSLKAGINAQGEDASDELKRTVEIISKAMDDPTSLCDSKTYSAIGDAIIAVDGMKMDCYAANNDKEWQVLAEALSKELINPVRQSK